MQYGGSLSTGTHENSMKGWDVRRGMVGNLSELYLQRRMPRVKTLVLKSCLKTCIRITRHFLFLDPKSEHCWLKPREIEAQPAVFLAGPPSEPETGWARNSIPQDSPWKTHPSVPNTLWAQEWETMFFWVHFSYWLMNVTVVQVSLDLNFV